MADHLSFLGSALFICFIAGSSCKPTCGKEFYLDDVTGNCDPCSQICQHAEIQKTADMCHDKCPGYLKSVKVGSCLPTQYFDDVVERCEECDSLCRHAQQTGRQEQCTRHCPEWTATTVYSIGAVTVASSDVHGSTQQERHASMDSKHNILLIVLGSIAGAVTVIIVAFVVLKTRPEQSRRISQKLTKAKCTKSGTQEQGQAQEEMQRLNRTTTWNHMVRCSTDFYWEVVSGTCQPCNELCHQAEVRGTVTRCRRLCPVSSPEAATAPLIAPATTTSATLPSHDTSSSEQYWYSAAEYAVIILAVGVVLISLVSLTILLRKEIQSLFSKNEFAANKRRHYSVSHSVLNMKL